MSEDKAKELGLTPLAKIKAHTSAGVDPAFMGLGPIPAVRKILQKTGLSLNDFGVIELNEAFAAQAIGCLRELKFDLEKTNLSGKRHLHWPPYWLHRSPHYPVTCGQMVRNDLEFGLATLCIGGGQGMATVLERV